MAQDKLMPLPPLDPITKESLTITELTNESGSIRITGRFEIPRYAKLDAEMTQFLEVFLRCRGILSSVEKEMGISYPTVRGRLDQLLTALELSPIREAGRGGSNGKGREERERVLSKLESGEITADEAKSRLQELGS